MVLAIIMSAGCQASYSANDKTWSPSHRYYFNCYVNLANKTGNDYAAVMVNLYAANGWKMTTLNTNAGDFSPWALAWDKKKDVLILYSGDIGTNAWKIEQDSFVKIKVTAAIEQQAQQMK